MKTPRKFSLLINCWRSKTIENRILMAIKIKTKTSQCLIKHCIMKMYGRVEA
jgi:hypothetical protein